MQNLQLKVDMHGVDCPARLQTPGCTAGYLTFLYLRSLHDCMENPHTGKVFTLTCNFGFSLIVPVSTVLYLWGAVSIFRHWGMKIMFQSIRKEDSINKLFNTQYVTL